MKSKTTTDVLCEIIDNAYPDLSAHDKHEVCVVLQNRYKAILAFKDEFTKEWDGHAQHANDALHKILGVGNPVDELSLMAERLTAKIVTYLFN